MNEIRNLSGTGAPFRVNVPPSQAFAHPGWRSARLKALDALRQGRSALLLGLPGTGKTLLLHDLAGALREEGLVVRLVERGDALDPGLDDAILLVDEAGFLEADALESLRHRNRPCILAALPGFAERLGTLGDGFVPVVLEPLGPEDVARYVTATLAAAGEPVGLLEPDAILALALHSEGLLRVVNSLAGSAMFLAEMDGGARVARRHVEEANSLRHGMVEEEAPVPDDPDRMVIAPDPALTPASPDRPLPVAREASLRAVEPVPHPIAPPVAEAVASKRGEPPASGGADLARVVEAPSSPSAPTAARRPVPQADAGARPASSVRGAAVKHPAIRRSHRLMAVAAGLALALLVGLLLIETAPPSGPADLAGVAPAPTRASPAAPATDEPEGPPPVASPPSGRSEQAGIAPTGIVPPEPEVGLPWQDPPTDRRTTSTTSASAAPDDRPAGTLQATGERTFTYRGSVFNETLRQGGRLMLSVRPQQLPDVVSIRFEASNGLIGSGELRGNLASDGRITASGTLMMGRNPHECELTGVISGDRLSGTATFRRSTSAAARTRSTFQLTRG